MSVRRLAPLVVGLSLAATGCLQYEADLSSARPSVSPGANTDCAYFTARADARMVFEGLEASSTIVSVYAYTLYAGPSHAGDVHSSGGALVSDHGELRRSFGMPVQGGQLYEVVLSGMGPGPVTLPGGVPVSPQPWSEHVKVRVTAVDEAGADVPLDCTPPPPPPPVPHGGG